MIHKNVKYGATEGVTVAEFGKGSILLNYGIQPTNGNAVLTIKESPEPGPIGQLSTEVGPDTDAVQPGIVFEFSNVESIDALLEELYGSRAHFIKDRRLPVSLPSIAVPALVAALDADSSPNSLYEVWKANIAMAFFDTCVSEGSLMGREALHGLCNRAADRFLQQLILSVINPTRPVAEQSKA